MKVKIYLADLIGYYHDEDEEERVIWALLPKNHYHLPCLLFKDRPVAGDGEDCRVGPNNEVGALCLGGERITLEGVTGGDLDTPGTLPGTFHLPNPPGQGRHFQWATRLSGEVSSDWEVECPLFDKDLHLGPDTTRVSAQLRLHSGTFQAHTFVGGADLVPSFRFPKGRGEHLTHRVMVNCCLFEQGLTGNQVTIRLLGIGALSRERYLTFSSNEGDDIELVLANIPLRDIGLGEHFPHFLSLLKDDFPPPALKPSSPQRG